VRVDAGTCDSGILCQCSGELVREKEPVEVLELPRG
jgi:hypothetical protein